MPTKQPKVTYTVPMAPAGHIEVTVDEGVHAPRAVLRVSEECSDADDDESFRATEMTLEELEQVGAAVQLSLAELRRRIDNAAVIAKLYPPEVPPWPQDDEPGQAKAPALVQAARKAGIPVRTVADSAFETVKGRVVRKPHVEPGQDGLSMPARIRALFDSGRLPLPATPNAIAEALLADAKAVSTTLTRMAKAHPPTARSPRRGVWDKA